MVVVYAFVIALGLVFGSFLYTMSIRLSDNTSVWKRSACRHCHRSISIVGLIPVIGYLIYRGRCPSCGETISVSYPVMELLNAGIVGFIFWKTRLSPEFLWAFLIFECLFIIAIIDFQTYRIFPQPIVFGLVVQTVWLFLTRDPSVLDHVLGLLLGAGFFHWISYLYELIRKRVGLGDGDAVLLGLIGYFFGWGFLLSAIFWGAVLGIAGGGILLFKRKQTLSGKIAFGPWLALSTLLIWRFPELFQKIPFDTTVLRLF